jgi:hypothetical protein
MLAGAFDQTKKTLPGFARAAEGSEYGANVLCVSDPTLALSKTLTLGWYIGTREESVLPGLLRITEKVAELANISAERIVFMGSSGGGFAALCAASTFRGNAIAINPQTDIALFYPGPVEEFALFFGGPSVEEIRQRFPERLSAIEAIRARPVRRAVLCQNSQDAFHLDRHYQPFCEALGLPSEGGQSEDGRFMTVLFDCPSGHGKEPRAVTQMLAAEPLAWLTAQSNA